MRQAGFIREIIPRRDAGQVVCPAPRPVTAMVMVIRVSHGDDSARCIQIHSAKALARPYFFLVKPKLRKSAREALVGTPEAETKRKKRAWRPSTFSTGTEIVRQASPGA